MYLGHSAFKFELPKQVIYVDPYIQEPLDWKRLPKADVILLSHGHFDHGVQMSHRFYQAWQCQFVGPKELIKWMSRKFRRFIPQEALIPLEHGESTTFASYKVTAVPAYHPLTRLGKTILSVFARSRAPGNPVNGYTFGGYYHSGDTVYTGSIAKALRAFDIHTACLPIGGKYKVATPQEALIIAEEIGAKRMVPMHWQALMEQVPFRYQPSHLVKLAAANKSPVQVCPMAIGEVLEDLPLNLV